MESTASSAAVADKAGQGHWHQGLELARQQQWPAAARAFGRATRAAPRDRVYWINLANAQRRAGAHPRAMAAARRCLQLKAGDPIALRLLGDCLLQSHRYAEAATVFEQLEDSGASEPDAMLQHASVLMAQGRHREAAAVLLRALAKEPALVKGHALLADACREQGAKREAVECMKTVLALSPDDLEAMSHLSFEKRHLCDWSDLDADIADLCRVLQQGPADRPRVAAAFGLLSLPLPPALQLEAARGEALLFAHGVQRLPVVLAASRRGKRLRLGFVSFDFREHPVSQLLVEVLEALDRKRFEVLLYSAGPDDGSPLRARVVAAADRFIALPGLSDAQAAERIRADGVDVLVDLMGHTRGNRMGIFARRPAPLQVGWLGYPGSTGADYIDYIVGDRLVTPLALAGDYSEKIAQLPLTLQPNGHNRPLPQPMSRAAAGLPEGGFVLCAFNHTYKILPPAFDVWCGLLQELPQAVLWLRETNAQLHDNVRREAAARGIAPQRIVFAPPVSWQDHFSRLALADVFVDTWPYNAHTTASDALWAGVPVVTHYGRGYASRVAASVLSAAGIGELAFATIDEYRLAVLALALEPALLEGYRRHLVERRQTLPLFDAAGCARGLEALFTRMAERWHAGLPPDHLAADTAPA